MPSGLASYLPPEETGMQRSGNTPRGKRSLRRCPTVGKRGAPVDADAAGICGGEVSHDLTGESPEREDGGLRRSARKQAQRASASASRDAPRAAAGSAARSTELAGACSADVVQDTVRALAMPEPEGEHVARARQGAPRRTASRGAQFVSSSLYDDAVDRSYCRLCGEDQDPAERDEHVCADLEHSWGDCRGNKPSRDGSGRETHTARVAKVGGAADGDAPDESEEPDLRAEPIEYCRVCEGPAHSVDSPGCEVELSTLARPPEPRTREQQDAWEATYLRGAASPTRTAASSEQRGADLQPSAHACDARCRLPHAGSASGGGASLLAAVRSEEIRAGSAPVIAAALTLAAARSTSTRAGGDSVPEHRSHRRTGALVGGHQPAGQHGGERLRRTSSVRASASGNPTGRPRPASRPAIPAAGAKSADVRAAHSAAADFSADSPIFQGPEEPASSTGATHGSGAQLPREVAQHQSDLGDLRREFLSDMDSSGIAGVRRGMPSREQKMTIADLHQRYGHLGSDLDGQTCSLCAMAGGKFIRHATNRSRAPAAPELPGYAFTADVVFLRDSPAFCGSQYALVMRCMASGFYVCDYGKTKDFGAKMIKIIKGMRAKSYYSAFPYKLFTEIKSDMDGSWAFEKNTAKELEDLGVTLKLNSPSSTDDHRANAAAEAAVRFIMHTTKMILYQNRLPTTFWVMAMQQAVMLRNLFPIRKYAASVHSGDAVRPLEQISRYQISRGDCNQLLHALVPIGALCLVHQAQIRGSTLDTPNCRWGIAAGMIEKTSSFFCPFAGPKSSRWYSRNYVQLKLPAGMGYHAALNIAQEPGSEVSDRLTIPPASRDIKLKNIITIPNLSSLTAPRRRVWTPITSLKTGPLHAGGTPSIIMTDEAGCIYAHTEDGRIVKTSQVLSIKQREQPNIGLLDHLRESGIPMGGALDAHRRFDPGTLLAAPAAMVGRTFWKRFDTGLWLGTVRLYDPVSELWTVTFRDNTHEDYEMREMEFFFAQRSHDPTSPVDTETDHGREILRKAEEGPDDGPLPIALLKELQQDMGDYVRNPRTGVRIDWPNATQDDVQAVLNLSSRMAARKIEHGFPETGAHPEPEARQSRRKSTPTRNRCEAGKTGRTAGVNPAARGMHAEEIAAKRQRTTLISTSGGEHPADDGVPWSETTFNWKGHCLPAPTHGEPPSPDIHFEVDFNYWDDHGLTSVVAPKGADFNTVCQKLGLDNRESRLYFAWLGPLFGPRGTDGIGVCGARFSYPWGRGSQTILDGQRFPVPTGRLWEKLKEQARIKSNAGNTDHANIRVARAVLGSILTNEKCHDSIRRATVNKVALRDAYVLATESGVHEQDQTLQGSKLRALMGAIGHGAKRIMPTLMTLGVLASSSSDHWVPQIVDPFSTKTILSRGDLTWRNDSNTHIHINSEGLIDVRVGQGAQAPASSHTITANKAAQKRHNLTSVRRGEPIINPRTGRVMAPRTVRDIPGRPDEKIWWEAIEIEMAALESMKVLIHDLTFEQVRAMGVTTSMVPLNIVLSCKWTPLGTFERAKARCCVVGSPHFMKKGIHYGNTFAPTPSFEVTRLLMALCCAKGYARFQWDIKNAFASVPIKTHERVALRYPKGAERFDKNGRPLFAIMDRALYGVPSSSRKFIQHLQSFILKRFNTKGFKAHNTRSDPCLYVVHNPRGRVIYLSAWCDDVQCVGANIKDLEEVCAIFKEVFELKICDVQELLGVRRDLKQVGSLTTMNITQPGFIVNTYDEHRGACEQMFKKARDTPFPPKEMLSRSEIPQDEVAAKKMHEDNIKKGYMSITGSILWAARQCLPELAYGASQLCRLMSTPTDKAYEHALHMLSYMHGQKDRGIRYSSDGNRQVLACYDSSFKPDPQDSKCQYGYCIYFMNAPIAWCSRKHDHIALSSSHAEYMALAHTARTVVWIRNLFKEMGLEEFVDGPTVCLGDNINANMLAKEGKVSTQNRHILLAYHYAKEAYETGEIDPRRVCTRDNPSDVLTKANPRPDIIRLVPGLTGWGGEPPIPPKAERE